MRKVMWLAAGVLSLAPGLALAQDVSVDFDKGYDFSKLKTYSITIGTTSGNPLAEKRVITEIDETLAAKGWTKVDQTKADAVVMLHGASEKKQRLDAFYSGGYGGWGYGGWGGMGMGSTTVTATDYKVGTLVVDIFDAKSKALVFRGTATDELSDKAEKDQKKIAKAADKMFKDFPSRIEEEVADALPKGRAHESTCLPDPHRRSGRHGRRA